MKIIVGIDFSDSANNAIDHAALWAKKFTAEIILVHSYMPIMVDPNIPVGSIESLQLDHIKELEESITAITRSLKEKGISAKHKVVLGDVKNALLEVINEENADMLIVGKTKNPNFLERLIGSNAQHLINNIKIPLLIIPQDHKPKELKIICYATEIEFEESDLVDKTNEIAKKFKADIHVFRVKVENAILNDITSKDKEEFMGKTSLSSKKIHDISAANLREGVSKFIVKMQADMLVLISHKRGLLDGMLAPSQSKMLIGKIDIPILIYHFT